MTHAIVSHLRPGCAGLQVAPRDVNIDSDCADLTTAPLRNSSQKIESDSDDAFELSDGPPREEGAVVDQSAFEPGSVQDASFSSGTGSPPATPDCGESACRVGLPAWLQRNFNVRNV